MTTKKEQQEMKRPDQFQERSLVFLNWLKSQQKILLAMSIPIALGLVGFAVQKHFKKQALLESAEKLSVIDREVLDIQMENQEKHSKINKDIQKYKETIANIKKASDSTKKDKKSKKADKKLAKDLETKIQGLEKNIAKLEKTAEALKPNLKEQQTKYLDFFKNHEDLPIGWRSALSAIHIATEKKDFKTAKELLGKILLLSSENETYQSHIREFYISVLNQLKEFDMALEEINILFKKSTETEKAKVLLLKGKTLYSKKDIPEAKNVFKQIMDQYNESEASKKASNYLTVLE